ncbi:MAG: F0F1 ATP synthase subunit A [Flavisolibacter sp.]|nr:F0F1 ATP synthase subunit A [Flavisolibacter sp.]
MIGKGVKCLLVAAFSLFCLNSFAQEEGNHDKHITNQGKQKEKKEQTKDFDANGVIFGHVLDAHQFHFFSYKGSDGQLHHVGIPLPVILYSPEKGFSVFSSSKFHHGEDVYNGYLLVTPEYKENLIENGYSEADVEKLRNETIIAVDENSIPLQNAKVYDLSLTRNVVQMFIALVLLVWMMLSVAKRYREQGSGKAPRGLQNLMEVLITFTRDEVAKPNLGHKYGKYMPFLLTVFFFILINNIVGLIPGAANVTGNISFTLILGLVAFIVILISSNKHYWGHILWPPVPGGVKPILILVEFLSVFTKPFALIIRLFANMIAGHIIIICLISLIFIFGGLSKAAGWGFMPVSVAFTIFIYFIEILVAFLQAYIFTNLTAVFIGQAIEGGHDEHHEETPVADRPVIV